MIIIKQLCKEYFTLSVHCFNEDDYNIVNYLSMDDAPEMELFLLLVVRGVTVFARMWAGILYSWADLSSFFNCSISSSKKVFSFSFRRCSCLWFLFSFSIWLLREETDLKLYKDGLNIYRYQIAIQNNWFSIRSTII